MRNVQIPSAYSAGLHAGEHQLSASRDMLSFGAISKLQGSRSVSRDASFPPHRVRCCAPVHPPFNGCLPARKLNKSSYQVHDEDILLLKKKGSEIVSDLRGTCIYLVGMMGSGKSTVGKVLAEALGYHFIDSDKVIEEAAGGVSVAELFKQQDETSFRDAETQVLKQLCCNARLVVATGGGIVIRPENWSYLRYGVTVWLDVPLKSLAERVVAAGMHSRPLLGGETKGKAAHSLALAKLTSIFEKRACCYENADVRVSLEELALSLGYDVCDLTPTLIALQTLDEINKILLHKKKERK